LPLPTIDDRNLIIRNDTCSLNTGSITGLKPIPDQPGMSFAWLDENGTQVANQLVLRQLKAGMYRLNLTDSRGCSFTSKPYTIGSISLQLGSPSYNSTRIEIARSADAILKVQNGRLGNYELIDASTGALLQQNNSGNFVIPRVGNDLTVQVRYSAGSCSSTPVSITIKVFDDTRLTIPNAFSPNNDGINDVFRITAQGYFRLSYLKIFNRWGQLVFESHDLNLGWDGRRNGTNLPTGVYYWVLSGIDVHNLALTRNGSITLIR
jgi:gliding motility-associated-like protein